MKRESVREPPALGTTSILSSDVSRTPSDAKKTVNFKTAARIDQIVPPSDIVSDKNFDPSSPKQIRNQRNHPESTYAKKKEQRDSIASHTGKLIPNWYLQK